MGRMLVVEAWKNDARERWKGLGRGHEGFAPGANCVGAAKSESARTEMLRLLTGSGEKDGTSTRCARLQCRVSKSATTAMAQETSSHGTTPLPLRECPPLRTLTELSRRSRRHGSSNDSVSPPSLASSLSTISALSEPHGPPTRITKLNYCEEALPFYWLAQALLNILNTSPPMEPGWNAFSTIKYSEMLKSSRMFTRMGEGVSVGGGYGDVMF